MLYNKFCLKYTNIFNEMKELTRMCKWKRKKKKYDNVDINLKFIFTFVINLFCSYSK